MINLSKILFVINITITLQQSNENYPKFKSRFVKTSSFYKLLQIFSTPFSPIS